MENKKAKNIEEAINFIEAHLDRKLELDGIAQAMHYSKYHLHRTFTETVGMTIHDYVQRRQLTEAAKLLVFSERPIIEIAQLCGHESQQAFTTVFKAMYKMPPAKFRERQVFYPLQMKFTLHKEKPEQEHMQIRFAEAADIPAWMEIVRLAIDGYPYLEEEAYMKELHVFIEEKRALMLTWGEIIAGVMAFSYDTGSIEFLGIHPQYRRKAVTKVFLEKLMKEILPGQEISMTTYRQGDRADTGYREELKSLGFAERELLMEFGYPTQKFVLSPTNSIGAEPRKRAYRTWCSRKEDDK